MAIRRGVALVLTLILVAIVVSLGAVALVVAVVGREPGVPSNSTLVLRIGSELAEAEPGDVFSQFIEYPPTLRSVVDSLRKAKVDRRVAGVVLVPTGGSGLWGKVQELREAVLDFKSSRKPIVGYLEYGGEQEYYLASACDKVFLMPASPLDLSGLATYEVFFRGALDKIGAYPDMLHIGDYKTAANTFTERTYTAAHREMAESLTTDLYEQLIRGIAEGRRKTPAEVRAVIDRGPLLPEEAVRLGLVDDLAYEDQIDDKVNFGGQRMRRLDAADYRRVSPSSLGLERGPKIAVIYAEGTIVSGRSSSDVGNQVVGSDTLVDYIRKARADRSIRAIVLRVDSPGGSAIASDVVWRELMISRPSKPIVSSMSDLAASGGYYIAMPAHAIVAQPGTLTGSIGVVMGKFAISGTLDKLGLNMEAVSRGTYAQIYSPDRPFTPEERIKVEEQMQATYDLFVEKAAQARNTTPEKIDAIGQGRVWTGRQAKQLGLVDELGGLHRALAVAKQRAGIDPRTEVQLVVFPPRRTLYELVSEPFAQSAPGAALLSLVSPAERRAMLQLTAPLRLFRSGEPLALMPNVFVR
ncbi:MAG TPA: signal peptide peptidase SppA [Vicinamibacterales bacterium]|nr:signal peptide peptidase SppA [Vicinamibacterales bacterium]